MSPDEAADPFFDDRPWTPFAEGKIICPGCGEDIPVPVVARINGEATPAIQTEPDLTEVWAHSWRH
jgi:hypothetical protein